MLTLGQGVVPITLDRSLAPCAVNAFVSLTAQKFFDGTSCHRLTTDDDFKILQCGDPSGTGRGGPGYSYAGETNPPVSSADASGTKTSSVDASTSVDPSSSAADSSSSTGTSSTDTPATTPPTPNEYPVGTVAMANTALGGTNGSQFFIVYGEFNLGSSGYTKIGTVSADGLAVIDAIAAKGTVAGKNPNGALDAPAEPVTISTAAVPADAVSAEAPPAPATSAGLTDIPPDSLPVDTTSAGAPDAGGTGTAGTDTGGTATTG